jgi:hypothetical protein
VLGPACDCPRSGYLVSMSDDQTTGPEEFTGTEQIPEQQPQGQDVPEDEGVLQPGDTLESDDLQSDPLDTGISPPERHPASERHGVTAAEAREGESLDQRLTEEEPDVAEVSEQRAGRLVAPDEGSHPADEPTYLARDVGVDGAAAGAEEAAVHIADEEPRPE